MNKDLNEKGILAKSINTDHIDDMIEGGMLKDYTFKSTIDISIGNKHIEFNNCIFEDNVKLSFHYSQSKITFVNCKFIRSIKFHKDSNCDNNQEVIIRSCHIENFTLNQDIQSIVLSYSTIGILVIATPPQCICLDSNIIYDFRVFGRVCQNDNALFMNNVFKYQTLSENKRNLDFEKEPGAKCDDTDESINRDITYRNTYEAILKYSDEVFDRRKYAKLKFKKRLCSANNKTGKYFVFLTGGFCFPIIFIIYSVLIIVLCGMAYHIIDSSNTWLHSFYYSGITFTTLGYGEISESTHKIIKLLSVLEAFTGVVLSSCLVTSIINKYVD